ncbi:MAG: M48 family metallopeptidase [bacterium]|nr:M48 family metallopeptidase [bacterium]
MEGRGLYHDLKSGEKCSAYLELQGNTLVVSPVSQNYERLEWNLSRVSICEFTGPLLRLQYGNQTLEFSGDLAPQVHEMWMRSRPPESIKKSSKKNMILSGIGFTALFLVTAYVLWFKTLPWLGEKAAGFVPLDTEINLGKKMSASFEEGYVGSDSSTYYLQQFVDTLKLDNTYSIHVQVLQSEDINAFALPGGTIFVFTAIIDRMQSYEELVALLGHEVTHIKNRHSLKSICRSAANRLVFSGLLGGMNGLGSGILEQVNAFKELDYSRELETEADNLGLTIMYENRVDPRGMLALLELLKKEGEETPGLMKYLSTHPETDERITNISKKIEKAPLFPKNPHLEETFRNLQKALANGK